METGRQTWRCIEEGHHVYQAICRWGGDRGRLGRISAGHPGASGIMMETGRQTWRCIEEGRGLYCAHLTERSRSFTGEGQLKMSPKLTPLSKIETLILGLEASSLGNLFSQPLFQKRL